MLYRTTTIVFFVLSLFVAVSTTSCTTHYIPNTDVEDTDDNRQVISFCEQYRKAVEHRSVDAILKMVSPRYFEDGGNVDASDDLDREGLADYLSKQFMDAKAIRYEIRYRRVGHDDSLNRYYVDYTYSASFKIPGPEGKDVWKRVVADNRLELAKVKDSFQIVAGL